MMCIKVRTYMRRKSKAISKCVTKSLPINNDNGIIIVPIPSMIDFLLFKLNNCAIPTAAPYIHAPTLKKTPATIIRIINASNLSNGIYYYSAMLLTKNKVYVKTGKMVKVK